MNNKNTERKENFINTIKPLFLTFLPIIFKNYYDLWKVNKNISENIKPLLLFIIFVLLDVAAIVFFSYYDFKIRDKEHKSQIKILKEKVKQKDTIIKNNSVSLKNSNNEINALKKTITEKNKKIEKLNKSLNELSLENEEYKHKLIINSNNSKATAFTLIDEIVSGTADNLYQEIKRIKNDEHTEIIDWSMIETYCDKICKTLFEYILNISKNGKIFSVSIIFKMNKNSKEGYIMPSRYNSDKHTPKIYRNFESKDKYENYCFHELFANTSTNYKICMNKEEIKQNFENYKPDYSQYIGIPICCTGGKKIALIQVVAYKDSVISDSRESLESLITELFIPIANSVFLINKIENSLQILNEVNTSVTEQESKKGIKDLLPGGRRAKK